ncbi:heterokaryon incompatibility protein-domain-containing protein [Xylariaceae sp. FL0804]|nr:heterokaryon incompatibility protein-domain-containing protein [Xylariaceae sp. FL0804]
MRIPKHAYELLRLIGTTRQTSLEVARTNWIWMDCICIDQTDEAEKKRQMALMRVIFRRAAHVVVYLGPEAGDRSAGTHSDAGIALLKELAGIRKTLELEYKRTGKWHTTELKRLEGWKALEQLLERPWWRRVWTFQEFILPKSVTVWCGKASISRETLFSATYVLWRMGKPKDSMIAKESWRAAWERRRVWKRAGKISAESLPSLMAYNSYNEVQQPADRIYGVSSLAQLDDRGIVNRLPSGYCVGLGATYTVLVREWVETHRKLDIICYASLFKGGAADANGRPLPSWVPDWSVRRKTSVVPLMISQRDHLGPDHWKKIPRSIKWASGDLEYGASGDRDPDCKFFEDGLRLRCRGVLVDYIDVLEAGPDSTTDSHHQLAYAPAKDGAAPSAARDRLVDKLARCLVLGCGDKYLHKRVPVEEFRAQLLEALAGDTAGHKHHGAWTEWCRRNRHLRIDGHVLGDLCRKTGGSTTAEPEDNQQQQQKQKRPERDSAGGEFLHAWHYRTQKMGFRLMSTLAGEVGMACRNARRGDAVCILFGCSVPVVLRQAPGAGHVFVGECFLDGYMYGEGLGQTGEKHKAQDFMLV